MNEDDDRPRRRRDDEDDDHDDRPRRAKKSGPSGLVIGLIIGAVLLCGGVPIAAILIGLLLPAVQKVREAAGRASEQSHLKQIGLGMYNDADVAGRGFHAPFAHDPRTGELYRGNSFRVSLLPYIEQDSVYRQFDLTQPWDSPRNRPAADTVIPQYTTPHDAVQGPTTPFRAFVGGGALFNEDGQPVQWADVSDGTANTIMLVHAAEAVPWAKPQELRFGPGVPLPALGHQAGPKGFNVLMADGSVRFVKGPVPDATLRALVTRAGGEVVPLDW